MKTFSKKQIASFKKSSNVIERLTAAVVEQGLDPECFEDVVNHGIDGGFSGFVYYADTFAFYKAHREDILKLANEQYEEIGYSNVMEMIASFGALKGNDWTNEIGEALRGNPEESTQVTNVLAWYAAEEVVRHWVEG